MSPLVRLLLFPLLLLTSSLSAQLNGTYTVGPTGTYTTLAAAITALQTNGVSGPVFMDIQSGTYTGNWSVPAITGASATNTITFRSQALNNTAVVLVPLVATQPVLGFMGSSHVTLQWVRISATNADAVRLSGVVNNARVLNCILSTTGPGDNAISVGLTGGGDIHIESCDITAADTGVEVVAYSPGPVSDIYVANNVLAGIRGVGIRASGVQGLNIQGNDITAGSTTSFGVELSLGMGQTRVTGNRINWTVNQALRFSGDGLVSQVLLVENNMVRTSSTSAQPVIYFFNINGGVFRHNSARSTQARTALSLSSSTDCTVEANIFQTTAAHCVALIGSTGSTVGRNVYFNSQPNMGVITGVFHTWASWQALGFDVGSVFANPAFVSTFDLHIQAGSPAQDFGTWPPQTVADIDGTLRGTATTLLPDAGAHERTDACAAGLSGTYPIGPTSLFPTFTSAINTMVSCGISGPVVFEVADGTYTEQIVLPSIPGNSTSNTITFRGQGLDSSLVILTWPTGSGAPTVRMSGADRVTFEHMTIQRTGTATLPGAVVDWESTIADATTRSQYTTIRNCRLISSATSNALSALVLGLAQNDENDVRILNCVMQGGHTGVRWNMNSLVSLTVRACVFSGQYNRAIACITPGTADPELNIENNIIQAPTFAGTTAVQVEHNSNTLRITGNRITVPTSNGIGIDITNAGIDPYWTIVGNNMVQCTGTARGIRLVGANTGLGLYHNSVSTAFGYPLELPGTGTGNYMVGNAFRSTNTYVVYRAGSVTFTEADHNALFSPSANFVWWGAAITDIAALRCLTGQQLNSIQTDPLFVNNTTDLHLQSGSPCAGQSRFISGVDIDFDGELLSVPVSTQPDIGADEINADCTFTAGTYVIGSSGAADFPTFNAAVSKLNGCGINGPVVFEVENGTYTEQVRLAAIKGTSSVNTVTFRGQALNSSTVILQSASSTTATNNHLLANTGADHVRFEHMTLRRTGTFTNARVVHLNPACDAIIDMRISDCIISNSSVALLTADLVYRAVDPMRASFTIENCALQGGGYAVYAQPAVPADTVAIIGCTRTGGAGGMVVESVSGPITIQGNQLAGTATDAVVVSQCTGSIDISRNRITGGSGTVSSGIIVLGCLPVAPARVVVANNEVIFSGGYGIRINGASQRVDVVFNSVQMLVASRVALLAINGVSATDTRIRNNIFSSIGTHAASVSLTGITAERNLFWRTGTAGPTVYWNSVPYSTASALTAGSGTNASTLFQDPLFYDHTADLHSYAMHVDQAAVPFAGIASDRDGQPRHAITPDIGAFEFQPTLWNETFNTCSAADPIVSNGSGIDQWIYKDHKVVARFNDNGQNLGTVTLSVYVNNGPVRQSLIGQHYMDRNWQLTTQNPITTGAIVRLFHSTGEFNTYAAADPVVNVCADAGVAHYAGANENCQLMDNPAGNAWVPLFPASPSLEPRIQSAGGTNGYTAVVAFDGEFYITSMGSPLPVELLSFTAQRIDEEQVELRWTTASEQDNAGFELWRRSEGEEQFVNIGWVDGAGFSQQLLHYTHADQNRAYSTTYYYLRQVDHEGSAQNSSVVAVNGSTHRTDWSLAPNPARDRFTVQGLPEAVVGVRLFDVTGRSMRAWSPAMSHDLGGVPTGVYIVQVELASGAVQQQRLVVE